MAVAAPPPTRRRRLVSHLPGVASARSYERAWLGKDLVAGLVLTALLVPQGMAYAELAGLPPITGLYTSMLCLAAYALFGPSRVLVLGPDSSLGPMIAATILPLVGANGSPERAVALASVLAIVVGVMTTLVGVAGLGFVADLLAKPTQIGYLTGLALTIVVGQLPKLFGFSVDANGLLGEAKAFVTGVADGDTVPAALLIGATGLVLILVLQRWMARVPGVLITVVLSIVAVVVLDLGEHGVKLVGVLPEGFPPLTVPDVSLSDIPLLLAGAAGIALVSLTDTISTSAAFAAKRGQRIRPDQEMIAVGAANIGAGLFQGFAVSTSGSRTAVADKSGAQTQLTGVVGAVLIGLMLLFVPGLLRDLPQSTLAAVVIAASLSLADVKGLRRLWHLRRLEFSVAVAAFLGVALLGVLQGIGIAVALSILNVFRRLWWPYQTVLGRVAGLPGYHDVVSYPDAELVPGLVVYRFDAPLIFANARTFDAQVRLLAEAEPPPRWVVVAAEPITDIDTTAADMLAALIAALDERGITFVFAELKDPVRRKLEHYQLVPVMTPSRFQPTIEEAVAAFRRSPPPAEPGSRGADDASARPRGHGGRTSGEGVSHG